MARFAIFCFVGRGHLDPIAALGRRLVSRGHRVTVFHLLIAQAAVRAAGLEFYPLDRNDSRTPLGRKARNWAAVLAKSQTTVDAIKAHAQRVLQEGSAALTVSPVDMVIADQMDVAAGTVAELLGIPFVNVSCGPPVYLEEALPAPYFGWRHSQAACARLRNRVGNYWLGRRLRPVLKMVNHHRRIGGLPELTHVNNLFSKKAIITQLPEALEFSRSRPLQHVYYTGQFVDGYVRKAVHFPWERLNGKRLVYASMGTIRNNLPWVFRTIAEASASFDVQLVMSLGAGPVRPADLGSLPGNPVVVEYAPQIELIRASTLVINCAGLNTTLDCVSCGTPMVAIPVAEDQPGIAARIRLAGMGIVVPLGLLSASRLRRAMRNALTDPFYKRSAQRLQSEAAKIDGVERAADIIETLLSREITIGHTA